MKTNDLGMELAATGTNEAGLAKRAAVYIRVSDRGQLGRDGDADGYSLPAQQKACEEAALKYGASVVKVYVERAESAKTDGRPMLAKMWSEIGDLDVDYLVVHKLDRFARNRFDDADMVRRLIQLKITLISASENIDDTPQGQMMHGILATLAEYYSNNLAQEVKKGLHEKHAKGGTPFRPPLGYLPKREMVGTQDIRTVVLDEERAELIRRMFDLYATGEWPLIALASQMEALGLTSRPTAKRPAKALGVSAIHKILSNPYYAGIVIYTGKRSAGRHEALVTMEQFAQVQVLLAANRNGDRLRVHEHFLRGALTCDICGGRLVYGRHRGRTGQYYEYFSCINRVARQHEGATCPSRHYPVLAVERAVENLYHRLTLTPKQQERLREDVRDMRAGQAAQASMEQARHAKEIADLEDRQRKLLHLYYEDLVTEDVLHVEREELRVQKERAEHLRAMATNIAAADDADLDTALAALLNPRDLYLKGTEAERRALNRAIWAEIRIREEDDDEDALGVPGPGLATAIAPWQKEGDVVLSSSGQVSDTVHDFPPLSQRSNPGPSLEGRGSVVSGIGRTKSLSPASGGSGRGSSPPPAALVLVALME